MRASGVKLLGIRYQANTLIGDPGHMGAADIALTEIIEDKMSFEMPELVELTRPVAKKRKKH